MARYAHLDGLRGIASLVVTAHHCYVIDWKKATAGERAASVVLDPFAVAVFFAISGFSIASIPPKRCLRFCLARWPRLALPVLAATLWIWLLWPTHDVTELLQDIPINTLVKFFVPRNVCDVNTPTPWARSFLNLSPSGAHTFQLWTMFPEMRGSVLVVAWNLAQPSLDRPLLVLSVASAFVVAFEPSICMFVLGIWLRIHYLRVGVLSRPIMGCAQCAAYIALKCGWESIRALPVTPWVTYVLDELGVFVSIARCALIFCAVNNLPILHDTLANMPRLGKLSFSIYLLHIWARNLILYYHAELDKRLLIIATLALVLPSAHALSLVDERAITFSKQAAAAACIPSGEPEALGGTPETQGP